MSGPRKPVPRTSNDLAIKVTEWRKSGSCQATEDYDLGNEQIRLLLQHIGVRHQSGDPKRGTPNLLGRGAKRLTPPQIMVTQDGIV